jgi:hypothetical protein
MTPEQKLDLSLRLYNSAWDLKAEGLRKHFPGFREEEIQNKVKEAFFYART